MRSRRSSALAVGTVAAMVTMGAACTRPGPGSPTPTTVGPPPSGEPGPAQKGPDPTAASVAAARGPFATATTSASGATGFGGGTIHYPTDPGTYGAVVVLPGFINPGSVMNAYGPRLASNGFVVLIANTRSTTDLPSARASQFLAALDWLTTRSSVANRTDRNRTAVMGYSMGGGGALDAAKQRSSLRAAIPMAPWNTGGNYRGVQVPTMVVACTGDFVASPAGMARPFYESLSGPKAYFEVSSGNHGCPMTGSSAIGTRAVPWLKRFVDDDRRYDQFLCPPMNVSGTTGWRSAAVCN
jgi:dienelactone hydrolase